MFMMSLLYMTQGPAACFAIPTQTSSNLKSGKYLLHNSPVLSLSPLPSPASLLFWNVLQALGNSGGCQNNAAPKNTRGFSGFPQCQGEPAAFMTALRQSQALSTLHKWTETAEDPRVPGTKLQWSAEEEVAAPICTISEMRMCQNSYKQLTATSELFIKGGEFCSPPCALGAPQLPNLFSFPSLSKRKTTNSKRTPNKWSLFKQGC